MLSFIQSFAAHLPLDPNSAHLTGVPSDIRSLITLIGGLWILLSYVIPQTALSFRKGVLHFTDSLFIPPNDLLFKQVMRHLAQTPEAFIFPSKEEATDGSLLKRFALLWLKLLFKSNAVTATTRSTRDWLSDEDMGGATNLPSDDYADDPAGYLRKFKHQSMICPVAITPARDTLIAFFFENHLLVLDRGTLGSPPWVQENITLYGPQAIIKRFLRHVQQKTVERLGEATSTYIPKVTPMECTWRLLASRKPRASTTMILEANMQATSSMESLTEKGTSFMAPPGNGKTSLAMVVAARISSDVYAPQFTPNMTDESLINLIYALPNQAILLLEDIDRVKFSQPVSNSAGDTVRYEPDVASHQGVSLGGLLNALDGPYAREDLIVIMTANNPENIPDALIRPGRIDLKLFFPNATKEMLQNCHRRLCGQVEKDSQGDLQAEEFAQQLPAEVYPIAAIQGFLLDSRERTKTAEAFVSWSKKNQELSVA
ncbi:AAA-type ATPase Bcs1 [Penicillium frequentans]|uniref:AAA-type ATPase Bcs1 n=1 Tax=Penicillium frequentans TaxID=3151616 RepID=A0AAD6G8X6_9EURO|nr:AAA-type ATPase Bcs1 [Penicillium glabrum]